MVSLTQVQAGANAYIKSEIVGKLTDWRRWVIGAGADMLLANITGVFNKLKNNEVVKLLGAIDENDNIDIEKLYQAFRTQAQQGAITFDVPMLGPLTLNVNDVDKIYHCVINGGAV